MGIATAIKTRRGGGWRSQVASSLAALGAAGILMTGCSDESVSPAAPSAVTAVVSEPTASAAANGIVTPSGGGLPEPGRAQAAPDAEPVVGMEADTADTLLVKAASSPTWPPAESVVTNLRAETSVSGIGVDLSNDTGQSDLFADESEVIPFRGDAQGRLHHVGVAEVTSAAMADPSADPCKGRS